MATLKVCQRSTEPPRLPRIGRAMSGSAFRMAGLARYRKGRFMLLTAADGAPSGGVGTLDRRQATAAVRSARRVSASAASTTRRLIVRDSFRSHPRMDCRAMELDASPTTSSAGSISAGASGSVDRLDPATGRVRHYTTADGLSRRHSDIGLSRPSRSERRTLVRLIQRTLPPPAGAGRGTVTT